MKDWMDYIELLLRFMCCDLIGCEEGLESYLWFKVWVIVMCLVGFLFKSFKMKLIVGLY